MPPEAATFLDPLLLLRKGHPSVLPRVRFIPISQSFQIIANESLTACRDKGFSEGEAAMLCISR